MQPTPTNRRRRVRLVAAVARRRRAPQEARKHARQQHAHRRQAGAHEGEVVLDDGPERDLEVVRLVDGGGGDEVFEAEGRDDDDGDANTKDGDERELLAKGELQAPDEGEGEDQHEQVGEQGDDAVEDEELGEVDARAVVDGGVPGEGDGAALHDGGDGGGDEVDDEEGDEGERDLFEPGDVVEDAHVEEEERDLGGLQRHLVRHLGDPPGAQDEDEVVVVEDVLVVAVAVLENEEEDGVGDDGKDLGRVRGDLDGEHGRHTNPRSSIQSSNPSPVMVWRAHTRMATVRTMRGVRMTQGRRAMLALFSFS